ncbi:MAG: hypothetical protein KAQ85_00290 [Thermodesulfovibrionia bacterium]|nr:hypothetical protein [Thermodesulfovibrionia bacterium]
MAKLQLRSLGKGKYRMKVQIPGLNETQVLYKKDLAKKLTDKADKANGKYVNI